MSFETMDPAALAEFLQMPLTDPPEGVTRNLNNPKYHGLICVIVYSMCIPILAATLCLRLYAKRYVLHKFTIDDSFYLVAWVSDFDVFSNGMNVPNLIVQPAGVAYITLVFTIATGGVYGYHAWNVKIGAFTPTVIVRLLVFSSTQAPVAWLVRLPLFSLIYHIFKPFRWIRLLVYWGAGISGAIYLTSSLVFAASCYPRGGNRQINYFEGLYSKACSRDKGPTVIFGLMTGPLNVALDLYLVIIPIPAIRALQLANRHKLGIYLIFSAAIFGTLISAIAIGFRFVAYSNPDPTIAAIPNLTLCIIETTVALVIPCIMSLFAVVNHHRRSKNTSPAPITVQLESITCGDSGREQFGLDDEQSQSFNKYGSISGIVETYTGTERSCSTSVGG